MLKPFLRRVVEGRSLSRQEAYEAMLAIMAGEATPAQIAAFLVALRMKGETVEEIVGFVEAMRARAVPLPIRADGLVDTCGTGGDGADTFNISTAAAIVAASGGVPVAKHGNRAVSSRSGSADVLEALGVAIQLTPEGAARCLEETGLCFLFAPLYHPSMRYAAGPRWEIGLRTVFNLLGPLANPARATRQVVGVYDRRLVPVLAEVLRELGARHCLVVASHDGLDELSVAAPTDVCEVQNGRIVSYTVTPEDAGLARHGPEAMRGGDPAANAALIRRVFAGARGGPRDVVAFNAGAALYVGGRAASLAEGVRLAQSLIDEGAAAAKLEELVRVSEVLAHAS